ncbi:MAG: two-component system response regulator PilR (NtrC family) [Myxococcota bacterium]
MSSAQLLVVDDDRGVRTALRVNLSKAGHSVTLATNVEEALAALRSSPFDLVITDVKMPGETGLALLGRIREAWADTPVIVMTGYGSVEDAVSAMKAGAADYIIKPVEKAELLLLVDRALQTRALRAELIALRQEVEDKYGFDNIIGTSDAMVRLYEDISAVAASSATVLLHGPTGTGKELLAHAIHYRSARRSGPLVPVNCGAIPEQLLESELFGHERGAFTGAVRQHVGKFEQADGGTILLDEIGEMDLHMQVKLLRVLQSGTFQRVGGTKTLSVDVRIVAATNRDLREDVREGRFREDLFYRLNVVALAVPPLRDRRDDIPLLVDHFVATFCKKDSRDVPRPSHQTVQRLMSYAWPGNVRQLEHVIERAVILHRGGPSLEIPTPEDLRPSRDEHDPLPPAGTALPDFLAEHERHAIIAALKLENGVQARAARRLGISRSNLNYRIQKLEIAIKDVEYE